MFDYYIAISCLLVRAADKFTERSSLLDHAADQTKDTKVYT